MGVIETKKGSLMEREPCGYGLVEYSTSTDTRSNLLELAEEQLAFLVFKLFGSGSPMQPFLGLWYCDDIAVTLLGFESDHGGSPLPFDDVFKFAFHFDAFKRAGIDLVVGIGTKPFCIEFGA